MCTCVLCMYFDMYTLQVALLELTKESKNDCFQSRGANASYPNTIEVLYSKLSFSFVNQRMYLGSFIEILENLNFCKTFSCTTTPCLLCKCVSMKYWATLQWWNMIQILVYINLSSTPSFLSMVSSSESKAFSLIFTISTVVPMYCVWGLSVMAYVSTLHSMFSCSCCFNCTYT